jgi:hypothetical protein
MDTELTGEEVISTVLQMKSGLDSEVSDIDSAMDKICSRLQYVQESGLDVEVIVFALLAMKNDPTLSVEEAFEHGCREWDV